MGRPLCCLVWSPRGTFSGAAGVQFVEIISLQHFPVPPDDTHATEILSTFNRGAMLGEEVGVRGHTVYTSTKMTLSGWVRLTLCLAWTKDANSVMMVKLRSSWLARMVGRIAY